MFVKECKQAWILAKRGVVYPIWTNCVSSPFQWTFVCLFIFQVLFPKNKGLGAKGKLARTQRYLEYNQHYMEPGKWLGMLNIYSHLLCIFKPSQLRLTVVHRGSNQMFFYIQSEQLEILYVNLCYRHWTAEQVHKAVVFTYSSLCLCSGHNQSSPLQVPQGGFFPWGEKKNSQHSYLTGHQWVNRLYMRNTR